MPKYTQADVLKVHTPLGADALLLEKFRGREALSEPFEFVLDLLAEAETDVAFKQVLGQPATVSLQRPNGATRYFNGIISRFSEGELVPGPKGEPTFYRYQAVMVPKLWLLSRNVQSRNFQQMTVPDILMKVLTGLDVANRIQGQFSPRDYCAQYRESDLAFASRLMEDEGIFYSFEHSASGHQMILANTPQAHPEVAAPSRVAYERVAGGTRKDERVTGWTKSQEIRSGLSTLWDYCFEMPDKPLQATRQTAASAKVGTVEHSLQVGGNDRLELYDYPGTYAGRFDGIGPGGNDQAADLSKIIDDGTRTVGIRMQEEAAAALRVDGQGGCRQFSAGSKFTLQGHRNGDGSYVLTEVEHEASLEGSYTIGSPATLLYHNTFRCIPHDLPFRPARTTPKPRVEGPQTAVVVGPAGDDPIFCDKYGRVKVQFRWDRQGKSNADSSCWIRVAQPWAGSNWGAITLPRIGQEVVVGFLEGNPDEPMILGSVYNADQMPPFTLPAQKTQSGFKTRTVGSGAGEANFSGIGFEDVQGSEHLHIHSERDMTQSTERNLYHNVAGEKHEHVGSFQMRQVGGLPGIDHRVLPVSGDVGGGGSGAGGNSWGWNESEALSWNPSVGGTGVSLDLTVGWHRNNTLGLYSWNLLGQIVSNKMNPLALLPIGVTSGVNAAPTFLKSMSAVAQAANIDVILGGTVGLQYGPSFSVHRGSDKLDSTPASGTAAGKAIELITAAYTVVNLGEILIPAAPYYAKDVVSRVDYDVSYLLLNDLILSAWIKLEAAEKYAEINNALVAKQGMVALCAAGLGWVGQSFVSLGKAIGSMYDAVVEFFTPDADEGGGGAGAALGSGYRLVSAGSVVEVSAPMINIDSVLGPLDDGPSLIAIDALGNELTPGAVAIYGSGSSVIQGGAMAWLNLSTEEEIGTITADCGEDGTLTLQSGIVQEPNSVIMSPEGIAVSSTLLISLESDESSAKIDPAGITLTVAESSIAITAEGITLSVAESLISITAEGITIACGPAAVEITAEGIVVSGPTVDVTGDAEVGITGAAVTIT